MESRGRSTSGRGKRQWQEWPEGKKMRLVWQAGVSCKGLKSFNMIQTEGF